jgi:hypothetical protein
MILIKKLPINMSFKITYEVIEQFFWILFYNIISIKIEFYWKNSTFIIEVIIKVY